MTFLEELDDDTPCGWCGHAHGWHAAINDYTDCRHDYGNPYQPNIITTPDDWRAQAACVEWDPEIWYPDDSDTRAADFAKCICRDCPVKLQCAVTHKDEEFGIFGGTDTKERGRAHRLRTDRNERRRAKYAERIIP